MLIFRNPGLIDLEVVRNLGVSVKLPGSFGRFGTGLKFAIASILRGGGSIIIYRGEEGHILGTETKIIRDTEHKIITLDGVGIGIAVTFGRDWEPWMVLRELGCNALDEHGEFWKAEENYNGIPWSPDTTTIVVEWDELDGAYEQRGELFLDAKPALWENDKLRILAGPSAHIFYRGVRVYKTEKPSRFTYDILVEQSLTEDRTLASSWAADRLIREAWLAVEDKNLLRTLLEGGSGYDENKIDFLESTRIKPNKAFIDVAIDLTEARDLTNESAKKIVQRARRSKIETTSGFGSYSRVIEDGLSYAREQLGVLGVKFTDEQKIVVLEEFPDHPGETSFIEEGRIYLLEEVTKKPAREVMIELLHRWVELNGGAYAAVDLLIPLLVGKSVDLKIDEALVKEDMAIAEAEARREKPEPVPIDKRKNGERFIPEPPYTHVIEGTWTQNDKVVHREAAPPERAGKLNEARHHFSDGTQLHLTSRQLMTGESIVNKPGYTALVEEMLRSIEKAETNQEDSL